MTRLVNYHDGGFYNADCLDAMSRLPAGCVDMILADLPYGTTACAWDSAIPFEPLWREYWRLAKPNAAIVLTAAQPFTTALISSQLDRFKYCWVWDKKNPTGFGNASKQPLRYHEDVVVFYRNQPTYNPLKWPGKKNHTRGSSIEHKVEVYAGGFKRGNDDFSGLKFPRSIIEIEKHASQCGLHPTQKPIALFEYLIKTYTNPGEIVLDNTAGSGTTAVAARNTGRRWICMERDETYFERAIERVSLTHRSAAA
jgi:site-specific DNA-methyltransferase (adenine-specific)